MERYRIETPVRVVNDGKVVWESCPEAMTWVNKGSSIETLDKDTRILQLYALKPGDSIDVSINV